jgi:hypothetical protein
VAPLAVIDRKTKAPDSARRPPSAAVLEGLGGSPSAVWCSQ